MYPAVVSDPVAVHEHTRQEVLVPDALGSEHEEDALLPVLVEKVEDLRCPYGRRTVVKSKKGRHNRESTALAGSP